MLEQICRRHRWKERDLLDVFFRQRFDLQVGKEDPEVLASRIESSCSRLRTRKKPTAIGGHYGDGIGEVLYYLIEFRAKYGVPLDKSYAKFRRTPEFKSLVELAVIDSNYHAVVLPKEIEARLCKRLKIKPLE